MVKHSSFQQCLWRLGSSIPAVAISVFKLCGQAAVDTQRLISQLSHMQIHLTLHITKVCVDKSKPTDKIRNDFNSTLQ